MTESRYQDIKSEVLTLLRDNLDPRLTYHNLSHTKDVMKQAERIALGENIRDENPPPFHADFDDFQSILKSFPF